MHDVCYKENRDRCVSCNSKIKTSLRNKPKIVWGGDRSNLWSNRTRQARETSFRTDHDGERWSRRGQAMRRTHRRNERSFFSNFYRQNSESIKFISLVLAILLFFYFLWWGANALYERSIHSVDMYVVHKSSEIYHDEDGGRHKIFTIYGQENPGSEVEEIETDSNNYYKIKVGKKYVFVLAGIYRYKIIGHSQLPDTNSMKKQTGH